MWPFNRNKKQTTAVPTVAQNYYQPENTEHRGIAWLLAIATFLITLAFVLILFFAGKWAYKKFHKEPSSPTTHSQGQTPSPVSNNNQSGSNSSSGSSNSSGSTSGQSTAGQTNPPQTSSTSTSTPSAATNTTPATNPQLPKTGPDEDL